jgi:hypothetical protein
MKNIIYIIFISLLGFSFQGCEDDYEPGGTAVKDLAGDWWVTVDIIDGSDTTYNINGHFLMNTYNTAANIPTEMWLEDDGNFWDYKLKVSVVNDNLTFSTADFVDNTAYDSKVKITDGKVILNGTKSPSNTTVDYIEYKIQFDDDGEGGTVIYYIHGFRKTGFPEDDF